ncbi:MAG: HEAT repeat domain-containing protein, partial [Gemmataceae bacterium]
MLTAYVLLVSTVYPLAVVNDSNDPFLPKTLVRARAIRIVYSEQFGEEDGLQKVTFRIEHVYCGDAKLEGGTFQSEFSIATVNWQGPTFGPRIKEGEVGIWRLEPDTDDKGKLKAAASLWGRGDRYSGEGLAIPTPSRKIVGWYSDSSYATALKWADIVEKVYKAKRAERPDLLKRYVLNDNPHVAAWAVWILAEYKIPDLIPYLEKALEDPTLSIAAQVTIDNKLSKINRKKWLRSKQRVKLFEHWIGGDVRKPHDVMMIALRFKGALQRGDLDWNLWLPLMQKWAVQQYLDDVLEYQLYSAYRSNGPRT